MIILPKYQDIYMPKITNKLGLGGEFRCVLRDLNGRVLQDTGWFHNLITDYGLNTAMRGQYWGQYMCIGSSSTAPSVSDTTLGSYLASAIPARTDYSLETVAPNYDWYETRKARFVAGVATGTIRELGIGLLNNGTNLAIRAVLASPIVKNADNVLDVYYKFTIWPNTSDVTGTVTIASESYNYLLRGANYGQVTGSTYPIGTWTNFQPKGSYGAHYLHRGEIGATMEDTPATACPDPWSDGNPVGLGGTNNYWDWEMTWGLDRGNHVDGVRCVFSYHNYSYVGALGMQIRFGKVSDDSSIDKDETKTLTAQFRYQWTRH